VHWCAAWLQAHQTIAIEVVDGVVRGRGKWRDNVTSNAPQLTDLSMQAAIGPDDGQALPSHPAAVDNRELILVRMS
jgi:hypothetical protein